MTELRELVARTLREFDEESRRMAMPKLTESRRQKLADRILAIPRIAAALKLLDEHERLMLGGSVSTGVKLRPTK